MATTKIYDLAVVVGTYQKAGETKNRYQNVGAVLQKEDGGKFLMLERWFNPAGVPNPDNRSTVLLSMFEPKPRDGEGGGQTQQRQQTTQQQSGGGMADEDIPFAPIDSRIPL